MLTTDQLNQWFTVLGYGELKAPVWFVGIEPGGEQTHSEPKSENEQELNDQSKVRWDPSPCEKAPNGQLFTPAWKRPIEILQRAWGRNGTPQEDWAWAWQNMMTANLAPLPRKSTTHKLIVDNPREYHKRVRDERVSMLHRIFMTQPSLRVMIFHGKSAWMRYGIESGFGVTGEGWQKIQPSIAPHIQIWEHGKRRLVLTQSMTWYRYFNDDARNSLAAKLKEWRNDDKDWLQG